MTTILSRFVRNHQHTIAVWTALIAILGAAVTIVASGMPPEASSGRVPAEGADWAAADIQTTARVVPICFVARVAGDATREDLPLAGTAYVPDPAPAEAVAVLLLHGAGATRQLWDGGPAAYGVDDDTTLPRRLALAGYVAFTIDFLGYGDSPYDGLGRHGTHLTLQAFTQQVHMVVEQIRSGRFVNPAPPCTTPSETFDGPFITRVVLAGHGLGAMLARHYVTSHTNVAGMISIGWVDAGPSRQATQELLECQARRMNDGSGYSMVYCLDRGGRVANCEALLFWAPGAHAASLDATCRPETPIRDPVGWFAFPAFSAATKSSLHKVPHIPALLVYADHDGLLDGPRLPVEDSAHHADQADWQANCGCIVQAYLQQRAGHLLMLHGSQGATNDRIISWMEESGFATRAGSP